MSNRTVTKLDSDGRQLKGGFSTMSNRTVTKQSPERKFHTMSFSTMSNRTVTKPRHGPAPDLLALASG